MWTTVSALPALDSSCKEGNKYRGVPSWKRRETVFKTVAFVRSAILPGGSLMAPERSRMEIALRATGW